jgi:hypothetical protein
MCVDNSVMVGVWITAGLSHLSALLQEWPPLLDAITKFSTPCGTALPPKLYPYTQQQRFNLRTQSNQVCTSEDNAQFQMLDDYASHHYNNWHCSSMLYNLATPCKSHQLDIKLSNSCTADPTVIYQDLHRSNPSCSPE